MAFYVPGFAYERQLPNIRRRHPTTAIQLSVQYGIVNYEWDPVKNRQNFRKHGVWFADAVAVLEDEYGTTIADESDSSEQRFVTLGVDAFARVLAVVYTYRGENIRIISARPAERHEREKYEAQL